MPRYLFKVTGLVVVEAPNALQATKYVKSSFPRGKSEFKVCRISAGTATSLDRKRARNDKIRDYWVSARSVKDSEQYELVEKLTDEQLKETDAN